MEEVFLKLPRIVWQKENGRWTEPKLIRIKLSSILRYEEFGLDRNQEDQLTSLGIVGPLTKLVYHRHSESTKDSTTMRTDHMVIAMSPDALDRKLNAE